MHASLASFTFGAEFEVLLPMHLTRARAAAELGRLIGATIAVDAYSARPGQWKVVSDGSVRGRNVQGLEFVSPILSGDEGLEQIRKVADALRSMGATVNSTCGFHVHVGNHGGELNFFKSLVKLYGRYEDVLDSLMPASRRGNGARYCRSVKMGMSNATDCTSAYDMGFALARASGARAPKYHKVNLVPQGKPTVEFRHHAGTVDSAKAVYWVVTCLRIVAAAKAGKTGEGALLAIDTAMLAVKTRAVVEMCSRPEGATIREICTRFGFSVVSVKRHAALAGVTFTQRGDKYFIAAQTAEVNGAPVTLQGFANLIEADDADLGYFSARQNALAR